MPFSPERARPPGAHSLARRARPALQSPPAARAAAHRQGSAAGAKRRESEARRARRLRWNGDGPETASAPTAQRPSARRLPPRGPGRSRLPPPTPRPSGPESPAGDARPRPGPAPRSCGSGLRSELRSGAGLKPGIPSRARAGPEEGLEAGALDIRGERRGLDSASQPAKEEWGYNPSTSSIGLGLPAFIRLPSRPFPCPLGNREISLPLFHQEERTPERLEDWPEATRLISGQSPV
ncbi:translation initiation factor IF-2-like [Felis catus]|uniref:translation initiation factor IF-2-like n=1 Tax=Felis catus TaxID=9685 RepID=UPI001D19C64D|nr:translation initiation factor IF-2-like [Felis catus]